MTLDRDGDGLRRLLGRAAETVVELYESMPTRPVFPGASPEDVAALFDAPLPRAGTDAEAVVERVGREVFGASTLNISPRFLSYIMSGGTHVGVAADLLIAGLNSNFGLWHVSPAGTEIELRTVRWMAELIGYPTDTGGTFVSGGSAADLHGLATAVVAKAPFDVRDEGLRAGPPLTMYVSDQGHSALDKSAILLGLGRRHLRKISTRDDFTIDVAALHDQIRRDRAAGVHPICVIGNAGTVNTGAVDPLDALADVAEEEDLWFHVDGAYGAPAAGTDLVGHLFGGLARADSVALDPHKWLFVPFDAGCVLVRDPEHLRDAFSLVPDYLRQEGGRHAPMEYGFELSRRVRALKVWMTLLAYGADALLDAMEDNIRTMRHMADLVERADDLELAAPVPLSVVCFRYRAQGGDEDTDRVNRALPAAIERDGRVFVAGTIVGGRPVLRACSVNHRLDRSHVELALEVVGELGARLV
ncbi:MAG: pyridoxal-dependent decarboxylase [Egibacteraceae bacterium]